MPGNAIILRDRPTGPFEGEVDAGEEVLPGELLEMFWNSSAGKWEGELHTSAIPGLRVVRGGPIDGLDTVYADGDRLRFVYLTSGETAQVYVYGEEDGASTAISKGDILYKTASADHTTGHAGALDVNATDGIAVARAKEAVADDALELIRIEKL